MITRSALVLKMNDMLKRALDQTMADPEFQEYRKLANTAAKGLVAMAFMRNSKKMAAPERKFLADPKIPAIDKIVQVTMGGLINLADDTNPKGKTFREAFDREAWEFYQLLDAYYHQQEALDQ